MLMLLEASQFADHPDSRSLLLRNSFADLDRSGALLDTAKKMWRYKANIHYSERGKVFTFPSGATITFGYMEDPDDHESYLGTEWTFIGYDEATLLRPHSMTELASRQRKSPDNPVPIRRRWASNPGGPAHSWVRSRFIVPDNTRDRIFVPGFAQDNPHVDAKDYHHRLEENLSDVRLKQLRDGDWDVVADTGKYEISKIRFYQGQVPMAGSQVVRYWDLASTERGRTNRDPDYTVGIKMIMRAGEFFIDDMIRGRWGEGRVEGIIKQTALEDGIGVPIRIEKEPGSAGDFATRSFAKYSLPGYDVRGVRSTGPKHVRANPLAAAVSNTLVHCRELLWAYDIFAELQAVGQGGHDDIQDALSGAHLSLTGKSGGVAFVD